MENSFHSEMNGWMDGDDEVENNLFCLKENNLTFCFFSCFFTFIRVGGSFDGYLSDLDFESSCCFVLRFRHFSSYLD